MVQITLSKAINFMIRSKQLLMLLQPHCLQCILH